MIEQKKSRRSWVIAAVIILAVIGISYFAYRKHGALEITYRETTIGRSDLEIRILSTGTVAPQNRLEIKPPVAGRIDQVIVSEGQNVEKGQVLAWMSSTERAALIDAARAQGPAAVKQWERNYKPTPILAPIKGTIILRNVESGQTFTATDSVLTMSDRLTVKAQVDETDIAEVKLKQDARITLDAYAKNVIPARVDQIAYDAKTVNNVTTYEVDVLPLDTPEFMRSGMTANVTFLIASKTDVLTAPNDALKVRDNKYSILVKTGDKDAPVERPIEVGLTDGKKTEIMSGLKEGDVVLAAEVHSKDGNTPKTNPFSPMQPRRAATGGGGGGRH